MSESTQVFATLAGAVVGAAIGVVSGFLIQRQIFKRENTREMRDRVYGPMLMQARKMLENVTSYNFYSGLENPKTLMDDYLFLTIGQDLKSGLSEVLDRFDKYQKIRRAAEIKLDENAKQEVNARASEVVGNVVNIGVTSVFLSLVIGETTASTLDLQTAIFLKTAPQDFIKKEKEKWGKGSQVEARFASVRTTLENFELLYASMLAKMEKEPLYSEEREQRMRLEKELKKLIRQVEPFVKSKW